MEIAGPGAAMKRLQVCLLRCAGILPMLKDPAISLLYLLQCNRRR